MYILKREIEYVLRLEGTPLETEIVKQIHMRGGDKNKPQIYLTEIAEIVEQIHMGGIKSMHTRSFKQKYLPGACVRIGLTTSLIHTRQHTCFWTRSLRQNITHRQPITSSTHQCRTSGKRTPCQEDYRPKRTYGNNSAQIRLSSVVAVHPRVKKVGARKSESAMCNKIQYVSSGAYALKGSGMIVYLISNF
jgi:hypothetical protein